LNPLTVQVDILAQAMNPRLSRSFIAKNQSNDFQNYCLMNAYFLLISFLIFHWCFPLVDPQKPVHEPSSGNNQLFNNKAHNNATLGK